VKIKEIDRHPLLDFEKSFRLLNEKQILSYDETCIKGERNP
jgi:hypothetical protein